MWVIVKMSPRRPFDKMNHPTTIHLSEVSVIEESERLANNNVGETFAVYELVKIGESLAEKAKFRPRDET